MRWEWANTRNGIGITLLTLGEIDRDPTSLRAAIEAYNAALTVWTHRSHARECGGARNNIGLAQRHLAALTNDLSLFDAARASFEASLPTKPRATEPFSWAQTQWNLGDLALARHDLDPDPALLETARTHVLAAREVFELGSDHQTQRCDALLARIDAAEQADGE